MCVLLDGDAVVHLIDPHDLSVAAVAAKFVILAHDQGLDWLGRTDFGAQAAEAAARQVEIEIVEHLDLLSRLAVTTERNEIVRAGLGALITNDTRLSTGARFGLQPQDPPEPGRGRPPLGRL